MGGLEDNQRRVGRRCKGRVDLGAAEAAGPLPLRRNARRLALLSSLLPFGAANRLSSRVVALRDHFVWNGGGGGVGDRDKQIILVNRSNV